MAGPELAAAVSRAGGLGTIGLVAPRELVHSVKRARSLAPRKPIAVNLLLPFTTKAHVRACVEARPDAVVLFFGRAPRIVRALSRAGIYVLHQVGTPEDARLALADGCDALVAQGADAGGHLLGKIPASELFPRVRAVAGDAPVVVAGGIADRTDVKSALAMGASAVLCGTRFLTTEEASAHALYKQRVLGAEETIETTLFGLAWPARHRVVPNAATRKWCHEDGRPSLAVRAMQHAAVPVRKMIPLGSADPTLHQSLSIPLYSPAAPRPGADDRVLEVAPLYAGQSARRIHRVVGAEDAVRDLFRDAS